MQLSEISRVSQYYQDNPDKLANDRLSPPKTKTKDDRSYQPNEQGASILRDYNEKLVAKWKPRFSDTISPQLFQNSYRGNELRDGIDYDVKYSNGDAEKFLKSARINLLDDELSAFVSKFPEFYKDVMTLNKKTTIAANLSRSQKIKQATRQGMNSSDYHAVQAWVEHYKSMSRKTIPADIWPALQRLTVQPNTLPKTLYRGIFFDGAKIKDKEAWLKKWQVGNKPGVKPAKIQSWSSSLSVAVSFLDAQDFIKDKENGFAVLMKYESVDPNLVIADFRNMKDAGFWNQQEIVLTPAAKDYEVIHIIPYEDYFALGKKWDETELYKYKKELEVSGEGTSGIDYDQILVSQFFNINSLSIKPELKEQWRSFSKMTVAQVKKSYDFTGIFIDSIEDTMQNVYFPLYSAATRNYSYFANEWSMRVVEVANKSSIRVMLVRDGRQSYDGPETQRMAAVFDDIEQGKEFKYQQAIVVPAVISIESNDYNTIKFSIDLTGKFELKSSIGAGEYSLDDDELSVLRNQKLKNVDMQKLLLGDVQEAIEKSKLNSFKTVSVVFEE